MTVSLNKEVDKIFTALCIILEKHGPAPTAQQVDMIQQALEFAYKAGAKTKAGE